MPNIKMNITIYESQSSIKIKNRFSDSNLPIPSSNLCRVLENKGQRDSIYVKLGGEGIMQIGADSIKSVKCNRQIVL